MAFVPVEHYPPDHGSSTEDVPEVLVVFAADSLSVPCAVYGTPRYASPSCEVWQMEPEYHIGFGKQKLRLCLRQVAVCYPAIRVGGYGIAQHLELLVAVSDNPVWFPADCIEVDYWKLPCRTEGVAEGSLATHSYDGNASRCCQDFGRVGEVSFLERVGHSCSCSALLSWARCTRHVVRTVS